MIMMMIIIKMRSKMMIMRLLGADLDEKDDVDIVY